MSIRPATPNTEFIATRIRSSVASVMRSCSRLFAMLPRSPRFEKKLLIAVRTGVGVTFWYPFAIGWAMFVSTVSLNLYIARFIGSSGSLGLRFGPVAQPVSAALAATVAAMIRTLFIDSLRLVLARLTRGLPIRTGWNTTAPISVQVSASASSLPMLDVPGGATATGCRMRSPSSRR